MSLSYGSVCSGIEAASVAWEPLGFRPAWFAEIEQFPSAVLAQRFPNVPNLGDMTKLAGFVRAGLIEAPVVLVGGTPCQAFSVAGVRAGLSDPRGQLTLSYADLANAIDEQRPDDECVIYWENVPGVLSDRTNAFGCFLALLAGEDSELEPEPRPESGKTSAYWKWDKEQSAHTPSWPNAGCVYGPQRSIAWRVLDAQYFGVAQRRRRVFLVASARKGFNPEMVLFESDGVRRDIAPSRETGQSVTANVAPCLTSSRMQRIGDPTGQDAVVAVSPTLRAGGNQTGGDMPPGTDVDTADSLIVCSNAEGSTGLPFLTVSNISKTVNNQTPLLYAASVSLRGREGGATAELGVDIAGCLRASGGGGDKAHVLAPIAFSSKDNGADAQRDVAPTLRAMNHSGSHANAGGQLAVCVTGSVTHCLKAEGFDASEDGTGRGQPIVAAVADTLTANWHNSHGATAGSNPSVINPIIQNMAVRRLTPRECERLQGFPDDWTLIPYGRGQFKPDELEVWVAYLQSEFPMITRIEAKAMAPDGPRYKALGNSMAVPCMRWLGARLILTHPEMFLRLAA